MATDEEMAYKLVELYVRDVAEKNEKRSMGLNTILNAYIWSLARIKRKKEEKSCMGNHRQRRQAN